MLLLRQQIFLSINLVGPQKSKVAQEDYTNTRINLFHMSLTITQRHPHCQSQGSNCSPSNPNTEESTFTKAQFIMHSQADPREALKASLA